MTKGSQIGQQQDNSNYILNDYKDACNQAKIWHRFTTFEGVLGIALIIVSVILLLIGLINGVPVTFSNNINSSVTAILGIVTTILRFPSFSVARYQDTRVDKLRDDLYKRQQGNQDVEQTSSASPSVATISKPYSQGYGGNEEYQKGPSLPVQKSTNSAPPSAATQIKPQQQRHRRDQTPQG